MDCGKSKLMRRLITRLWAYFTALIYVVVLAGCGGDQQASPALTPTDEERPILNVFGPTGSKAALDALQVVLESSALPYELRVFESNATHQVSRGCWTGRLI